MKKCFLLLILAIIASHSSAQPPPVDQRLVVPVPDVELEIEAFEDEEISPQQRREHRQRYQACQAERAWQDSVCLAYFLSDVYGPALKDPKLPAENKRFLIQLKAYLMCPTDSCGLGDKLIRPVYRINGDSLNAYHSIVADFPWEESDNGYDGSGWGDDTLLTKRERAKIYRIVYANAPLVKYSKIQRFRLASGPCLFYKSYILRKIPDTDTLRPAFCSTFDLTLEWRSDPLMDSLLALHTYCENCFKSYCDPEEETVTFAKLKGVPNLYFTIDRDTGWESWYPTRELMMNYKGKAAISLWRHQVEMVGCSCI
jgi:hypothetical protein